MSPKQRRKLVEEMALDGAALNDAALAEDFDEARFRANLILAKAEVAKMIAVREAAADALTLLGPPGADPDEGYGLGLLNLTRRLAEDPDFQIIW